MNGISSTARHTCDRCGRRTHGTYWCRGTCDPRLLSWSARRSIVDGLLGGFILSVCVYGGWVVSSI